MLQYSVSGLVMLDAFTYGKDCILKLQKALLHKTVQYRLDVCTDRQMHKHEGSNFFLYKTSISVLPIALGRKK